MAFVGRASITTGTSAAAPRHLPRQFEAQGLTSVFAIRSAHLIHAAIVPRFRAECHFFRAAEKRFRRLGKMRRCPPCA
jgi:hypothetical protein